MSSSEASRMASPEQPSKATLGEVADGQPINVSSAFDFRSMCNSATAPAYIPLISEFCCSQHMRF